ncbi:MAG: hypothetical protein ACP5JF_05990 [Candidatus Methanodesulfokora sp.]
MPPEPADVTGGAKPQANAGTSCMLPAKWAGGRPMKPEGKAGSSRI